MIEGTFFSYAMWTFAGPVTINIGWTYRTGFRVEVI